MQTFTVLTARSIGSLLNLGVDRNQIRVVSYRQGRKWVYDVKATVAGDWRDAAEYLAKHDVAIMRVGVGVKH